MNKFMGVDVGKIKGLSRTTGFDSDWLAYLARVWADGGTVIDESYTLASILHAKQHGYWTNVKFWISPSFGVKKDGANKVSKIYDIKGVDLTQGTGAYQPAWNSSTNSNPSTYHTAHWFYNTTTGIGLSGNVDFTTVYVCRINSPAAGIYFGVNSSLGVAHQLPLLVGGGTSNIMRTEFGSGTGALNTPNVLSSTLPTILIYRYDRSKIYLRYNTSDVSPVNYSSASILNTSGPTIGRLGSGGTPYYMQGYFFNALVLNKLLSTAEVEVMTTFMHSKYIEAY